MTVIDPLEAVAYLENVKLPMPPNPPDGLLGAKGPAIPTPPEYASGVDQAVTVGSQIAEFAANVPADMRPRISNSFLLAQLAANREIKDTGGGTKQWYDKYVEVLTQIGWLLESKQMSMREVSTDTLEVHKEIIPLLIAVLGTAAIPVTAVIISVLKSLADMDKDQPWITLFDRESQRASANQFQMSYASLDESAGPRISLVCFELDASRSLTQVLFFKFSTTKATLRHFGSKLGINPAVFERSIKVVEDRIADYVNDYIEDIKL